MSQHNDVLLPIRHYTRADFTALRAYLNRIPVERIGSLYYSEDDLERLNCTNSADLRHYLESIRDDLILRASDANPLLAHSLQEARKHFRWSGKAIDYLVQAADEVQSLPRPGDPVSMWFRPIMAQRLKAEGAVTLMTLLNLINTRGIGWYRPIPRIGQGKANAIVRWLQYHNKTIGTLDETILNPPEIRHDLITLNPEAPVLAPLERIQLPNHLSGTFGQNRSTNFCLITASNDLEAIDAYLYRYRGQDKTHRSYQKELERFLLWCILCRRKPMSGILTNDCEAYKDFLAAPAEAWIGKRATRLSGQWRPFAGVPSAESQRYAIQVLRNFFTWLVNVRYLGGNPWITVANPMVEVPLLAIQIDKALPQELWRKLSQPNGILDQLCQTPDEELRIRYRLRGWAHSMSMSAQFRLVRAALLLLGDGGLRREEACTATRHALKPLREAPDLWELNILGKRNKRRLVFLPQRAVDAIQAHWKDRDLEQEFEFGMADIPLIAPLFIPTTPAAHKKHHLNVTFTGKKPGFTPDSLYQLVTRSLVRIAEDTQLDLDESDRQILKRTAPHAFRHTFGTVAAANEVPIDVLQKILGHASLQTTTIYIQAEKKRAIQEIGKFYRKAID